MIPFISFNYQLETHSEELILAVESVIKSKWYVLGKNVTEFEKNYSKLNSINYTVGVGSGLDALIISLKALNISKEDEVIVASNAYIASWLAITSVGAKIIPLEPDIRTFNLDANKIEEKITSKTKAIMPVHLYGQPCEMDKIMAIAKKYNLYVVEDNAQAHLAKYNNQITGSFGDINATSFYPTKNIGAFGEAGCITTQNLRLSEYATKYRNYGFYEKYFCDIVGSNSRLDELQAAILNVKLKYIEKWTSERQLIAKKYDQLLSKNSKITVPYIDPKAQHVYHLYVIKVDKRDQLQQFLKEKGIGTAIHYPIPPHLQKAYAYLDYNKGDFPIAEELADTSLSLPLYPGLNTESVNYICRSIDEFFKI
jgi:dTDP-4-amino-4,6-dideoxygalactose transaminase